MKENKILAVKSIAALVVIIIMFLFALNGRYHYNSLLRIDKWTNKVENIIERMEVGSFSKEKPMNNK